MKTVFDLNGFALEITTDGFLTSPDGVAGACSKGSVGLQVISFPLPNGAEAYSPRSVMQIFVKPSQARAIASSLLSAATEVRQ